MNIYMYHKLIKSKPKSINASLNVPLNNLFRTYINVSLNDPCNKYMYHEIIKVKIK